MIKSFELVVYELVAIMCTWKRNDMACLMYATCNNMLFST